MTITISDLINLMKKAKILDSERLNIVELIEVIEKYHAKDAGHKLSEKLNEQNFRSYLRANPRALKINAEI